MFCAKYEDGSAKAFSSDRYPVGSSVPLPDPPAKDGYEFVGWENADAAACVPEDGAYVYALYRFVGSTDDEHAGQFYLAEDHGHYVAWYEWVYDGTYMDDSDGTLEQQATEYFYMLCDVYNGLLDEADALEAAGDAAGAEAKRAEAYEVPFNYANGSNWVVDMPAGWYDDGTPIVGSPIG